MNPDNSRYSRMLPSLVLCLSLSACGTLGEVKPDQDRVLMAKFAEGGVTLGCALCSPLYIFNQQEIWTRYQTQDWHGLAIAVMKAGWRQDVTYYFLGAAAEGLGYLPAADRYYRFAGALATGSVDSDKCKSVGRLCGTLSLPRDIYPRIQAVNRAMAAARAEQARMATMHPAVPLSGVSAQPKDDGWIDPPPATEEPPR